MTLQVLTAGVTFLYYLIIFSGGAQAGLIVFNFLFRTIKEDATNESVGLIFGTVSLIYSLILAFVIVAVWSDYESLKSTIGKETDKLHDIIAHASLLPDTSQAIMFSELTTYCNSVLSREWSNLEEQDEFPSNITPLRILVIRSHASGGMSQEVFTLIDKDLETISDFRRERLDHTHSQVPEVIWLILKAGSVSLILFSYFINVPHIKLKKIYLFFLSSMVAMSLFLVDVLDDPFHGSVSVSRKPFEDVLRKIFVNNTHYYPQKI